MTAWQNESAGLWTSTVARLRLHVVGGFHELEHKLIITSILLIIILSKEKYADHCYLSWGIYTISSLVRYLFLTLPYDITIYYYYYQKVIKFSELVIDKKNPNLDISVSLTYDRQFVVGEFVGGQFVGDLAPQLRGVVGEEGQVADDEQAVLGAR